MMMMMRIRTKKKRGRKKMHDHKSGALKDGAAPHHAPQKERGRTRRRKRPSFYPEREESELLDGW